VPAVAVVVTVGVTGCAGNGQATDFCTDYGDAMGGLVAAARDYEPEAFADTLDGTMARLDELRPMAPDERLGSAFDTAAFTFTVFSSNELLADFLTRADFSDNAMVLACAEYGVELTPAGG
jgi:hypothetical protein